jgi:hypothetical protein
MELFCTKPIPLRNPFAEILPNGPASKTAGGKSASGPDIAGVLSGAAGGGSAGFWSAAGAFWALQTEASANPNVYKLIFCHLMNRIISPETLSVFPSRREKPGDFAHYPVRLANCIRILKPTLLHSQDNNFYVRD